MKIRLLLPVLFFLGSIYAQDANVTSLKYAFNSWKSNKALLDQYTREFELKTAECKKMKADNEAEIKRLKDEKEKVRQELLNGSFCDQCNRSKSEIELAEKIPFTKHIDNVKGTIIPASPEIIRKRMDEFDSKIQALTYAIMTCEGDAFMLSGKVKTYQVYVDSNVKTAEQNIRGINAYLAKELSAAIGAKNDAVAALNKTVKQTNDGLAVIDGQYSALEAIENKYADDNKQLEAAYKTASGKLQADLAGLTSKLETTTDETEKNAISGEIATLGNAKTQTDAQYNRDRTTLLNDYRSEKESLQGSIAAATGNTMDGLGAETRECKNTVQEQQNKVLKLLNFCSTNFTYIKNVIAQMKLQVFLGVTVTVPNDKVLTRINAAGMGAALKNNIGSAVANANNEITACQYVAEDIENMRLTIIQQ